MVHISIDSRGSFRKTENALKLMASGDIYATLGRYAAMGTSGLRANTPSDTGITANAWTHSVSRDRRKYYAITWYNNEVVSGIPVVILLQYGHATKNGGFVQGYDFINPVIKPLFTQIENEVWKAVKTA